MRVVVNDVDIVVAYKHQLPSFYWACALNFFQRIKIVNLHDVGLEGPNLLQYQGKDLVLSGSYSQQDIFVTLLADHYELYRA